MWNTYFHLSNSHCLSAHAVFADLKRYHQIDSLLWKHGFLAPDNIFISHHDCFPHGYQLYLGRDCTFLPGSMPHTLNFPLPCLDSLLVISLSCGNLEPGKTCPSPGATTTTPTCWISFIQNEEFPPKFKIQEGSEWHIQSPLQGALKWKCLGYLSDRLSMRYVKHTQIKGYIIHVHSLWYQCICFYFSLLKGIIVGIWAGLLTEGGKKNIKPSQTIPPTILISSSMKKSFRFYNFFSNIYLYTD